MDEFINRFLRSGLRRVAGRMGLVLQRAGPLDLREVASDPLEAIYLARSRAFVIEVPIASCRGWLGFNLGGGAHPLVRTARALRADPTLTYERSPLKEYYEHFQPRTAADVLGFNVADGGYFVDAPAAESVFPWNARDPKIAGAAKRAITERENRLRGEGMGFSEGIATYGPVSARKGQMEIENLRRLIESIAHSGYRREDAPDGDIRATAAFRNPNEARFFIGSGHHRAAVLAALDRQAIPVRVNPKVFPRLSEANMWPHVRSGLFTLAQATEVFERMFAGRPPAGAVPPARLAAECG